MAKQRLVSGYSNICFEFILGIKTKIESSARMCQGTEYTSSRQGNYLLNYAVRYALFIPAKARRTTLSGEIQRDGLSLLFVLALNGLLFNAIHELVWVYFIENSEQNKYLHA